MTGRLKELINRGGEKISPIEVDGALLSHPAVAEAVSFGAPDEKYGEVVAAAVVLAAGAKVEGVEASIREHAAKSLAAFKVRVFPFFLSFFFLLFFFFFSLPSPPSLALNASSSISPPLLPSTCRSPRASLSPTSSPRQPRERSSEGSWRGTFAEVGLPLPLPLLEVSPFPSSRNFEVFS